MAVEKEKFDFSIDALLRRECSKGTVQGNAVNMFLGQKLDFYHSFLQLSSGCGPDRKQLLRKKCSMREFLGVGESVENFLGKKGEMDLEEEENSGRSSQDHPQQQFSWLNCTRFKPPKIPRCRRRARSSHSKRIGRGPRIPFSPHQISILEETFSRRQYLSTESISKLAFALHLTDTRVKIWFQNRRARYRREREAISGQSETANSTSPNSRNSISSSKSCEEISKRELSKEIISDEADVLENQDLLKILNKAQDGSLAAEVEPMKLSNFDEDFKREECNFGCYSNLPSKTMNFTENQSISSRSNSFEICSPADFMTAAVTLDNSAFLRHCHQHLTATILRNH